MVLCHEFLLSVQILVLLALEKEVAMWDNRCVSLCHHCSLLTSSLNPIVCCLLQRAQWNPFSKSSWEKWCMAKRENEPGQVHYSVNISHGLKMPQKTQSRGKSSRIEWTMSEVREIMGQNTVPPKLWKSIHGCYQLKTMPKHSPGTWVSPPVLWTLQQDKSILN